MFVGRLRFTGLDGRKVLTLPVNTDFSAVKPSVVRTGLVCMISPSLQGYNAEAVFIFGKLTSTVTWNPSLI
jgi:hypothetical protein